MSSLTKRILSALVMVPVALYAIYEGDVFFSILLTGVLLALSYEWYKPIEGKAFGRMATCMVLFSLGASYFSISRQWMEAGLLVLLALPTIGFLAKIYKKHVFDAVFGCFYVLFPVICIFWLRFELENGFEMLIWLMFTVVAMDTGAYVAGKTIGGPKLMVRISPNKTWAGLIGGMLAAGMVGGYYGEMIGFGPLAKIALLSALVGGWSQLGDLVQSAFKRRWDIKDSSNLIPGHGGVMDRLDGIIFAAPVIVLWLWY
jgi:phosphatidate cytidylyltransferase